MSLEPKVATSTKRFAAFNAVRSHHFSIDPLARIFVCTPEWFGPFDVEIDRIAMM